MDWSDRSWAFSDFVIDTLNRYEIDDPSIVTKKLWGAAVDVCSSPLGQLSLAIIDHGGFCSRHFHNQKTNSFNVIAGTLKVHVWHEPHDDYASEPADTIFALEEGMSWQIPINQVHMMEAATGNVVCMEAYFTSEPKHTVQLADIHRFTTGGKHHHEVRN